MILKPMGLAGDINGFELRRRDILDGEISSLLHAADQAAEWDERKTRRKHRDTQPDSIGSIPHSTSATPQRERECQDSRRGHGQYHDREAVNEILISIRTGRSQLAIHASPEVRGSEWRKQTCD